MCLPFLLNKKEDVKNMLHCYLYSTLGCHLCEQAEQVLAQVLPHVQAQIEWVDIIEREEWLARYSTSIPVLQRLDNQSELYWPFDAAQAYNFLQQ